MKKLLIILAVLVMDVGDDDRSSETKPCGSSSGKMKSREKTVIVPKENPLLIRLQS